MRRSKKKEEPDQISLLLDAATMWKEKAEEMEKRVKALEEKNVVSIDASSGFNGSVAIPGPLSIGKIVPVAGKEKEDDNGKTFRLLNGETGTEIEYLRENNRELQRQFGEVMKRLESKAVEISNVPDTPPESVWTAAPLPSPPVERVAKKCWVCQKVISAPYATVGVNSVFIEVCSPTCQREARNKLFSGRRR